MHLVQVAPRGRGEGGGAHSGWGKTKRDCRFAPDVVAGSTVICGQRPGLKFARLSLRAEIWTGLGEQADLRLAIEYRGEDGLAGSPWHITSRSVRLSLQYPPSNFTRRVSFHQQWGSKSPGRGLQLKLANRHYRTAAGIRSHCVPSSSSRTPSFRHAGTCLLLGVVLRAPEARVTAAACACTCASW